MKSMRGIKQRICALLAEASSKPGPHPWGLGKKSCPGFFFLITLYRTILGVYFFYTHILIMRVVHPFSGALYFVIQLHVLSIWDGIWRTLTVRSSDSMETVVKFREMMVRIWPFHRNIWCHNGFSRIPLKWERTLYFKKNQCSTAVIPVLIAAYIISKTLIVAAVMDCLSQQ